MHVARSAFPRSFGPYQIVASLGEGGGGEVFRAWDPRLQREVALKILRDRSATTAGRLERFLAEARAASALNHPNILTVYDASMDGDAPFIVSELIEGPTLREELRKGPIPLRRLLDLATQIADGLAAAHEAGIVHRDLKPENIMLTRLGRAKILDFGLAWSGAVEVAEAAAPGPAEQTETELGLRAGTVPYMSPEQARGVSSDFRSDQFSFGLILYEMATGRAPFRRGTPAATLDAIVNDEVPPGPLADPRAPIMLRWVIERCLAKVPEERYGVTADLYRDLRTLRDRWSEAAPPDAGAAPAASPRRRWATIGAALAAGLVAGALIVGSVMQPSAPDRLDLRFAPFATAPEYEGHPAWSPDSQTVAYAKEVNGLLQIHTKGVLAAASAPVTDPDWPYDCKHPFWSGDGKRIYFVSRAQDRDGIWSVGAAGGRQQLVVKNASRGAISPDGRTLAFLRDENRADIVPALALYISRPAGNPPWTPETVDQAAVRWGPVASWRFVEGALAFSPDGRKLGLSAVGEISYMRPELRGWQFVVLPLDGGAATRRLEWLPDVAPRVSSFSWMADSRHAVFGLFFLSPARSHLYVADLERDTAWPLTRSAEVEQYPSASPSADRVVFVTGEPDYDLTEIPLDARPARTLLASSRNESDPSWSHDGSLLAYVTDRRGEDEIWVRSRDGVTDRPVITQELFGGDPTVLLSAPAFSPDNQHIAYVRTGYKPIWPLRIHYSLVAGGTPVPLLPASHAGVQGAPSWSPDGEWIVFNEWHEERWKLVKVRIGTSERIELRTDGVPNGTPQWSPRNDWITWETAAGLRLVSPDGTQERPLYEGQFIAHTWSQRRPEILGVEETEDLRLALVAVGLDKTAPRILASLGPSPPVNNQVKGLSLAFGGESVATATVRMRGDLWILDGLDWSEWSTRLWRALRRP